MSATFPSYAKILLAPFGERRQSGVLRTEMESGPPKQFKKLSRVTVQRQAVIRVDSKADYLAFLTWFGTTINQGADWFDWPDPVTGSTVSARIVGGELGAAQPMASIAGGWTIPCVLETWSA